MAKLDEPLRRELERLVVPGNPTGVVEGVARRKRLRRRVHRVGTLLLSFAVIAGTVAGTYGLIRIFRADRTPTPGGLASLPSNGVIVFSRTVDESQHLFSVNPDGTGERQLTPNGEATYEDPAVSPDGRTIAVVHEIPGMAPGRAVIATVPIEGGAPTWLTDPIVAHDPAWSPDGSRIAFAGSPGGPYGIYIMSADGTGPQLVPGTDEIDVGHPIWSPDGRFLAIEAGDGATQQPQLWDIYKAAPDGSGLENLTNTPEVGETSPAWSPDGEWIAFAEYRHPYLMRSDGSERRDLFPVVPGDIHPPVEELAWSPDGELLTFAGTTSEDKLFAYTLSITDGAITVLGHGSDPSWQPVPAGASVEPVPTEPTESPAETAAPGRDLGLGYLVCRVSRITGDFLGNGTDQTAWVGTQITDAGRCPSSHRGFNVLAIDLDNDGMADVSHGPIECDMCWPHATPDLDGNGSAELLVVRQPFSILDLGVYALDADTLELFPVEIASPGDPEGGFRPDTYAVLGLGGDAGLAEDLACEDGPDGRVLIVTKSQHPIEGEGSSILTVHEATFVFRDGKLHIVGVRDYTEPRDTTFPFDEPSFATGHELCGAKLPR